MSTFTTLKDSTGVTLLDKVDNLISFVSGESKTVETEYNEERKTRFDKSTGCDEVLADVDLRGKTYIITGTNSGIGMRTAQAIAARGGNVIGLMRNIEKMHSVLNDKILKNDTNIKANQFQFFKLDLSDLSQIQSCSKLLLDYLKSNNVEVSGFVANAGVMFPKKRRTTAQGEEWHVGINFLGHFYLFELLKSELFKHPGRLIVVSAIAHRWGKVNFEDIRATKNYNKMNSYGQSCSARCIWASQFSRVYPFTTSKWLSYSLHPGILITDLQDNFELEDFVKFGMKNKNGEWNKEHLKKVCCTLEQSCATTCYGLVSNELNEGNNGSFLQNCNISGEWSKKPHDFNGYLPFIFDKQIGSQLWNWAESVIQKFENEN